MHGLAGFDAYTNALSIYRSVVVLGKRLPKGHVIDQLTRASESVALNVAEAHPAIGADRARRFRIASHEASECLAAIDLLEIRGLLKDEALLALRALVNRQCAMLWRLGRLR